MKSNVKMFLDTASVKDKVDILKELYKDIAGLGIEGDTQLAHVNSFEADLLKSIGGAGTLNSVTGLPQYKGGGGGAPMSAYQNTNQTTRLPDEVAPYAEDVLTEAQDYYRMIMNQGYDPYTGAVTAPQTQEQIDAQTGIKGLVGTGTALQQEGLDLTRQQSEQFTPATAQQYMSPYQQAVTDVEKRKATEDFERTIMPQFEKQAVDAGGMSGLGTRAGVQAGILGEGLQTRLGDIQTKGLQSSFLNAQTQFQDQKRREAAQAASISQQGPTMFAQGLAEQGGLQTVGEQRQNLGQKALDEQYYKYLEQKAFPEEQLAKYSGFVYGNPLMSQRNITGTASAPGAQGPSAGQQLLGTGIAAANTYRQMGQPFGQIMPRKSGGGLSDIVYRKQPGGLRGPDSSGMRIEPKPLATPAEVSLRDRQRREEKKRLDFRNTDEHLALQDDTGLGGTGPFTGPGEYTGELAVPKIVKEERPAPTISVGGISAEGYSQADTGERYKFNPRYDEVTQRNLAEEREALRSGYYADSDRERREYREGMFDRRRDERKEDYDRRKALIGEADPFGTLLRQLSKSLLRSRSGDPRDLDSVNTGTLGRISEGLMNTDTALSEADKERREKVLKLESEFSKRRSDDSEKEFEAEGEDFTRADERKALSLARKFKLEDKIIGLPYEKKKQAMAILLSKLSIKEKQARINLLDAQASSEGALDIKTTNDFTKFFDSILSTGIVSPNIVDGKLMGPDLIEKDRVIRGKIMERVGNNPEAARTAYVNFINNYKKPE